MVQTTRPAQLAEPTGEDIAGRIALDARALARRLDRAAAEPLATDENNDALRLLSSSLDRLRRDVDRHRPHSEPTLYPRV